MLNVVITNITSVTTSQVHKEVFSGSIFSQYTVLPRLLED